MNPNSLEVYEDCVGLYANHTNADTVTKIILDSLIRFNLPLNRCRGQCYDGAANMSGRRRGVATQIQKKEHRAMYIHCMGHCLNLAMQDTCRSIKMMSDVFNTVIELSKILKYSAKKKSYAFQVESRASTSYSRCKATLSHMMDCEGRVPLVNFSEL